MLLRIVVLFLLFMAAMAMIQKAIRPKGRLRDDRTPAASLDRLRCPTCRRVNLTQTPAPCERQDCRYKA